MKKFMTFLVVIAIIAIALVVTGIKDWRASDGEPSGDDPPGGDVGDVGGDDGGDDGGDNGDGGNSSENEITLQYYYNGADSELRTFTIQAGTSSATLTSIPTRKGYQFNGLVDDNGNLIFDAQGKCKPSEGINTPMTLSAQWKPLSYKIVFDAGEGTLPLDSGEREVKSGDTLAPFPVPTRDGYIFKGWKNSFNEMVSDGANFLPERANFELDNYPEENGVVTLTADYDLRNCTITFDFCDGRTETQELAWGADAIELVFPAEDNGTAEILSWSLSPGVQIDFTDANVKKDITFYAIWRDYKTFTFHFGEGIDDATARVYNGVSFEPPVAERFGYQFAGWYTTDTFSGFPESSITYHSLSNEFYAKWELATYTVTFNAYGGDCDVNELTYDFENALALPVVEKADCTFLGWCREEDLSDEPMTELPVGSYGDITLYAKYQGPKTFVYLEAGDGTITAGTHTVEYSAWNYLPVPTNEGYIFRGWYLGDEQMTDANGKTLTLWDYQENGMVLTAQYAKAYTVTVQINDPRGATLNLNSFYAEGDTILFDLIQTDGWKVESITSNLGAEIAAGEEFTMPAKDLTFTITVKPNTYTITLAPGANAYLKTNTVTVQMNGTTQFPTPAYQQHKFLGWYYGELQITNEGGKLVDENGWTIPNNVTLTAKYEYDGNTYVFIKTPEDLLKIAENPAGKYRLLCDVGAGAWTTIDFSGTLDGDGYTISGLSTALFGNLSGTVNNLILSVNIDASGWPNQHCGAVACDLLENGVVSNVTVKGSIRYTGTADVGGVVGYVHSRKTTITGCVNYASVTEVENDGYSVGGIFGAGNCPLIFTNNTNYGNISNANGNAGGIIGWTNTDGSIKNCENHAEAVTGNHAGGILGELASGSVVIDGCFTQSKVEGNNVGKYLGYGEGGAISYQNLPSVTVHNAADFKEAVKNSIQSEDIILAADIDLSNIEWTPMDLRGNLIGNGHTISNLTMTSGEGKVGLFATVYGDVENVILSNFYITATNTDCPNVGALCGVFDGTVMTGVTVESATVVAGKAHCGGVVGILGAGTVQDCVSYANVQAASDHSGGCTGGIVGFTPDGGKIENCEFYGTVQGVFRVGGICGSVADSDGVTMVGLISSGTVTGEDRIGGLFGDNQHGTLIIENCLSNGTITGNGAVGRYIGYGSVTYANLPVITIASAEDLQKIALHVAQDTFVLQNDISLEGVDWPWMDFYATLDGNGHKIIGQTECLIAVHYGTVKNLTLDEVKINSDGETFVAALAMVTRGNALVENVIAYGEINATNVGDQAGGIISQAYDNSVIRNCTNYININVTFPGQDEVGGVLGALGSGHPVTVENCINYGNVTCNYSVGGVMGYYDGTIPVTGCVNYGTISSTFRAGGIIGHVAHAVLVDACGSYGEFGEGSVAGKYVGYGNATYQNLPVEEIATYEDLLALRYNIAAETYILTADIDLTDKEWTPFAMYAILEGGDHKITGLTTNLFTDLHGTVKNLTLENVQINVDACSDVAALALYAHSSALVENVVAYGEINATNITDQVGGLISRASNSVIRNCTNYVNVNATFVDNQEAGGIVGNIIRDCFPTIENCVNYGNITSSHYAGGVIGWCNSNIPITNCTNYGTITSAYHAGGIVGGVHSTVLIDGCGSYGEFGEGSVVGKYVGHGGATYQNLPVQEIATCEDLLALKYNISAENYILTADIDLTGKTWTPFALYASLNGDGHKITGLTLNSSSGNLALFTTLNANVENLILENVNISSTSYDQVFVAGLAVEMTGGTLKNCEVTGTITTQSGRVAGLVAKQSGGTIENCVNRATVKSTMNDQDGSAAGVVAWFAGGTIKDCQNYGKIEKKYYTGGVIGYMTCMDATNLTNYGEVVGEFDTGGVVGLLQLGGSATLIPNFKNEGSVTGKENAGGVIGRLYATNGYACTLVLSELENIGEITGTLRTGGIIGYLYAQSDRTGFTVNMTNIHNTGDVTGGSYVGGLVGLGHSNHGSSKISGCTSAADIKADYYVGGLAGRLEYISLESCSNEGSTVTATGNFMDGSTYLIYAGGYAGYGYNITDCHNAVNINCAQSGSRVGGIAGGLDGAARSCSNSGTINAPKSDYVGGIAGYSYVGDSMTFTNNQNSGDITGREYVGGIFGRMHGYNDYGKALNLQAFTNTGTITGSNVSDMRFVGGIIGELYADTYRDSFTVTITNFQNTGDVVGVAYVGGLLGHGYTDTGNSKIIESTSSADITAEYYVGGLAGRLEAIGLEACSNEGSTVTSTGHLIDGSNYLIYIGGYVGAGYSITDCHNAVEINCAQNGSYVGGLAGWVNGPISSSTNSGKINAPKSNYVGGLAGYSHVGSSMTFHDNQNSGDVTGLEYVGGVFGYLRGYNDYGQTMTLQSFTNTGKITGSTDSDKKFVGGIIGHLYADTYRDAFTVNMVNFQNTGDVTGVSCVGGLLGYGYTDTTNSKILDATSSADITAEYYVGGLAGKLENIAITSCSNEGSTVTATGYLIDNTNFNAYVGGYVGYGCMVTNCTNAVDITYDLKGRYIGGIAGYLTNVFTSCTNSGDINAPQSDYVGGIVGYSHIPGTCTVQLNTNTGSITGNDYVGGIMGRLTAYNDYGCTLTLIKLTNEGTVTGNQLVGGMAGSIYAETYRDAFTITANTWKNEGALNGSDYVGGLVGEISTDSGSSSLIAFTSNGSVTCTGEHQSITVAGITNFIINE